MQRGRFAQEFLAELLREPKALRSALLGERARWMRSLKVAGREDLLFELELLLRALELSFARRHSAEGGRALLGQDFTEELRAAKDALHRAGMIARRLTASSVEQSLHFREFIERQRDEGHPSRVAEALVEQKTPEEGLYALRHQLRALQGIADQLLRLPYVSWQAFSDFSVLGEHMLLSSKYFRPPGALEFRTEYDRVGSVRLMELVKRVGEARARKALALGFLACFRLLRYLRHLPSMPVAAPRRSLTIIQLVRDEAAAVAGYLAQDLPRLAQASPESQLIAAAGIEAADRLREAIALAADPLTDKPVGRPKLEEARELLSEAAKNAASALAKAVDPDTHASELFDGQKARRERAERLRRDTWLLSQLLRNALDALFPAMKGEPTRAFDSVAALVRFASEFRQVAYHLLRAGDHEAFDRFFSSLDALTNAAPSPARDRHLYLECRRFLTLVERALALVGRRAELLGIDPDLAAYQRELARVQAAGTALAPALDQALADQLLAPPLDEDGDLAPEPPVFDADHPDFHEEAELELATVAFEREREPIALPPPPVAEAAEAEPAPPQEAAPEFDPEMTRRIWRGD